MTNILQTIFEICARCGREFRVFDDNPRHVCPHCNHVNNPKGSAK